MRRVVDKCRVYDGDRIIVDLDSMTFTVRRAAWWRRVKEWLFGQWEEGA